MGVRSALHASFGSSLRGCLLFALLLFWLVPCSSLVLAMEHRLAKRQKLSLEAAAAFTRGTPMATILQLAETQCGDGEEGLTQNELHGELHALDSIETPYGRLRSSFDFKPDAKKDDTVEVQYINPFALLFWLGGESHAFFCFLRGLLANIVGRMVFHIDEVTPGNDKRPGVGRKFVAFYWTLLEFRGLFGLSWNFWNFLGLSWNFCTFLDFVGLFSLTELLVRELGGKI